MGGITGGLLFWPEILPCIGKCATRGRSDVPSSGFFLFVFSFFFAFPISSLLVFFFPLSPVFYFLAPPPSPLLLSRSMPLRILACSFRSYVPLPLPLSPSLSHFIFLFLSTLLLPLFSPSLPLTHPFSLPFHFHLTSLTAVPPSLIYFLLSLSLPSPPVRPLSPASPSPSLALLPVISSAGRSDFRCV